VFPADDYVALVWVVFVILEVDTFEFKFDFYWLVFCFPDLSSAEGVWEALLYAFDVFYAELLFSGKTGRDK